MSKTFKGEKIRIEKVIDPFTKRKGETIPLKREDLPKVGNSIDMSGKIFFVDPDKKIVEEVVDEDFGNPNTIITSTILEVRRNLIRKGPFEFLRTLGNLYYIPIKTRKYSPGDKGWQERYNFLKI